MSVRFTLTILPTAYLKKYSHIPNFKFPAAYSLNKDGKYCFPSTVGCFSECKRLTVESKVIHHGFLTAREVSIPSSQLGKSPLYLLP